MRDLHDRRAPGGRHDRLSAFRRRRRRAAPASRPDEQPARGVRAVRPLAPRPSRRLVPTALGLRQLRSFRFRRQETSPSRAVRHVASAWQSGGVTKTQYFTATSLDGYIAAQDNSLAWLFEVDRRQGNDDSFARFFAEIGAMAMGATTYEWVLDHEQLLDHPEKWRAYYGETPCWVFTHRTLPSIPGADVRFAHGDVRTVHQEMTQAAGEMNIWLVGGGDLVGQFADRGLLDECCRDRAGNPRWRSAVAPSPAHRGGPRTRRCRPRQAVRTTQLPAAAIVSTHARVTFPHTGPSEPAVTRAAPRVLLI